MKIPHTALQTQISNAIDIIDFAADFYRQRMETFETHCDDVPRVAVAMEVARRNHHKYAEMSRVIRGEVGA